MKYYIIFLSVVIFCGCKCVYQIEVHKDGSAHIEQNNVWIYEDDILAIDSSLVEEADRVGNQPEGDQLIPAESIEPYLNSPIIKNYTWSSTRDAFLNASYDIDNVDSLGNYIDRVHNFVEPSFDFSREKFVMNCKPGDLELYPDTLMSEVTFVELNFEFPYKIRTIVSNNDKINFQCSGKQASFQIRLKSLYNRTDDTVVEIWFK